MNKLQKFVAKRSYHNAIKDCLRKGKPQDMDLLEWKKYKIWAKKQLREKKK